ncbi:flagellar motor switch protein FliN [bacterium]|nr:flagellar motor switch protein FliN [bacterium]
MSGFGNENNNENQDLGAFNMGSDSMFSNTPEDMQINPSMFSEVEPAAFQENINSTPQSAPQSIPPRAQAPKQPQQAPQVTPEQKPAPMPQTPQVQAKAPQAKAEQKDELDDEVITVKPIRFASFENEVSAVGTPRKNLDIMQDVKAKITVELGRCKMKVKKVLDIQKGSIIEINKVAGEQVELFVCGKLVAHGEVIVIEDKFGLRITSIIEDKSL